MKEHPRVSVFWNRRSKSEAGLEQIILTMRLETYKVNESGRRDHNAQIYILSTPTSGVECNTQSVEWVNELVCPEYDEVPHQWCNRFILMRYMFIQETSVSLFTLFPFFQRGSRK